MINIKKEILLVPEPEGTDDTGRIQAAVDSCRETGGRVVFAPGKYYTGTIHLCSNLMIEFTEGSEIIGSDDLAKYTVHEYSHQSKQNYWQSLFFARDAVHVVLKGKGRISGQGDHFPYGLEAYSVDDQDMAPVREYKVRPSLLYLKGCTDVKVEQLELRDAAQFAVLTEECTKVEFRDVSVINRKNQNTDGFHFSVIRDIMVENCRLDCGDDAVVLNRSAAGVRIRNCDISSRWAGIRIGPFSDGEFTRIEVCGCHIHHTYGCAVKIQVGEGGYAHDLYFHDLVMDEVTGPVQIRLCHFPGWETKKETNISPGRIDRITFERIRARVIAEGKPKPHEVPVFDGERYSCVQVQGLDEYKIGRLTCRDWDIQYEGGYEDTAYSLHLTENADYRYPEYFIFGIMPCYAMYAAHVEKLVLSGLHFSCEKRDVRVPFVFHDIAGIEMTGIQTEQ